MTHSRNLIITTHIKNHSHLPGSHKSPSDLRCKSPGVSISPVRLHHRRCTASHFFQQPLSLQLSPRTHTCRREAANSIRESSQSTPWRNSDASTIQSAVGLSRTQHPHVVVREAVPRSTLARIVDV